MSTEQVVEVILFCIVIVIPTIVFVMDDGKWQRKNK